MTTGNETEGNTTDDDSVGENGSQGGNVTMGTTGENETDDS
jgi:hypothetical protein